jgi:hypothetical protein
MEGFLALVLVLSVSLLATSNTAARLRRSRPIALLLSGGWMWLLMGVAIGPVGLGAFDHSTMMGMTPLVAFVLGWVGLMIGLGAHRSVFGALPRAVVRLTALDISLSVIVAGGLSLLVLFIADGRFQFSELTLPDRLLLVGLLVVCAIGWSMETRSLRSSLDEAGAKLSVTVRGCGGLGALVAVGLWGAWDLLVSADASGNLTIDPVHVMQVFVAVTLGVLLLGLVTRSALRLAGDASPELLTVFLGVVALLAGVSMRMGVPAILAGMLAGVLLTNLAGKEVRLFERFLLQAEHVVAVALSLVAGMLLDVQIGVVGVMLAVVLSAARLLWKPLILAGASRSAGGTGQELLRFVGVRQSPVAVALGVSLVLDSSGALSHKALGVIVLTGLLSEALPLWKTLKKRAAPMATTTTPDLEVSGAVPAQSGEGDVSESEGKS